VIATALCLIGNHISRRANAAQAQTRKGDRMRAILATLIFCACVAKSDDEIALKVLY
jgi:hypothetical protein